MKKSLLTLVISCILTVLHGQTNVSGGIFSNTTWTQANSPYIITDTVVVFPNVTLTIQPGVTVKFANNKRLEIRQGKLVALGTINDSITFTSNSSVPAPGIYSGLYLNGGSMTSHFDYCNFYYADKGINHYLAQDTVIVKNSNFKYNKYGIKDDWQSYDLLSKIDSCNFMNNTINGLFIIGVVTNCNISYNGNGIEGGGNGGLIQNCTVSYNQNMGTFGSDVIDCKIFNNGTGAYAPSSIKNCIINNNDTAVFWGQIIDSCIIKYNNYGIIGGQNITNIIKNSTIDSNTVLAISINGTVTSDTVFNCQIGHSNTGLEINAKSFITKNEIQNCSIGILLKNSQSDIFCNKICSNTSYGLQYTLASNTDVANNNWCTPDSSLTQPLIYDAHNNISLGIVYFTPLDTTCSQTMITSINEIENYWFSVFPNPFSTEATLQAVHPLNNATLTVNNYSGQAVKQIKNISGQAVTLTRDNLPGGMYFLHLTEGSKVIARKKLLIID